MKYILILLFTISTLNVFGQIKGNGKMITKEYPLPNIETVNIGLYAKTVVTQNGIAKLEITIDENLLDLVERSTENSALIIDQKEWIQPSEDVIIRISSPNFNKLIQSTHDETNILDYEGEKLTIDANSGKIKVNGTVDLLKISVGVAEINARKLIAEEGDFFFESWGTISANITEKLNANAAKDFNLELEIEPKIYTGNTKVKDLSKKEYILENESIRFIKFTLRNNSTNRHNFYVAGPKPDGKSFSYGFPMMPYQKRKKDWTNGTKVYKVNNLGIRKLVKTIRLEDEGKVVDIFEK
jgi:hypothetical protein